MLRGGLHLHLPRWAEGWLPAVLLTGTPPPGLSGAPALWSHHPFLGARPLGHTLLPCSSGFLGGSGGLRPAQVPARTGAAGAALDVPAATLQTEAESGSTDSNTVAQPPPASWLSVDGAHNGGHRERRRDRERLPHPTQHHSTTPRVRVPGVWICTQHSVLSTFTPSAY